MQCSSRGCVSSFITLFCTKMFFCLLGFMHTHTSMMICLIPTTASHTHKKHTHCTTWLISVSYVISFYVLEKFWTPTHRHSYATVNSDHAERPASQQSLGIYSCSKYHRFLSTVSVCNNEARCKHLNMNEV